MMFRIISKKEYQLLKEQNMERFKELWEMADAEVKKLQEENEKLRVRNGSLENNYNNLSNFLRVTNEDFRKQREKAEMYEKLYTDEYQKRLDLVARVREYEKECQKEGNNE